MYDKVARPHLPPVVILAGGYGTRVRHLLPGIPKPMAVIAGRPFIEWVVRFFAKQGHTEFIFSTGYLSRIIEAHFASEPVPGVHVVCKPEASPLGTAGGFLNCLDALHIPREAWWLVVNGDSLVFADMTPMITKLRADTNDAVVLGLQMEDASRYGTLGVSDGRLTAFQEKQPGSGLINTGVYGFTRNALATFGRKRPLSFETDVFPVLSSTGKVGVVKTNSPFLDIGTPESLAAAERFISENMQHFQL